MFFGIEIFFFTFSFSEKCKIRIQQIGSSKLPSMLCSRLIVGMRLTCSASSSNFSFKTHRVSSWSITAPTLACQKINISRAKQTKRMAIL